MKSLLLAAAVTGVALTSSAFAFSPKDSASIATPPPPRIVPSSVVKPSGLPPEFSGQLVHIEFSLDETGHPHRIRILSVEDARLKKQLLQAFSQWRFEQAPSAADANKRRFILPLQLNPEA